jgi:predicted enzyme related to lactoylglutathione lyase
MNLRVKLTIMGLWLSGCGFINAQTTYESSPAIAPQYDSTHVYVAPAEVDGFVRSFLGTFGGTSTKQILATVTPTPSRTTSQLLQTPVGTVSLFGFTTPIPAHFGDERNGYLVTDIDSAIAAARKAGAEIVVTPFRDPIGIDAIVQWPGGVNMQLYRHFEKPSYAPFRHVPENRVYVSADRADAFVRAFLVFSHGKVLSDEAQAPGIDIGRTGTSFRRIRVESNFGNMSVLVTDGHLPYPYGRETTAYEVDDLDATLAKARSVGVMVLVPPYFFEDRRAAIVQFPGGYVAEIHSIKP